MLPFGYHPVHCFSSCIPDWINLICHDKGLYNLVLLLHIHDALYTRLLLALSGGAGHFCQPLGITTEVRLWLHPLFVERSLSLSRYGCLQRHCWACHGVTRSMLWLGLSPFPERFFDRDCSLKLLMVKRWRPV